MNDQSRERMDRGQADVFPMWIPAVIGALIAVIIMLNWAGVLPP